MKYDFDIHWVFPQNLFADQDFDEHLAKLEVSPETRGNFIALFRDPETAAALRGADQVVRDFFAASGFGLNVYDSGTAPGYYPDADGQARLDVMTRLTENLPNFPLKNANKNGFEFARFLALLAMAQPIGVKPPEQPVQDEPLPEQSFYRNGPAVRPKVASSGGMKAAIVADTVAQRGRPAVSLGAKLTWTAMLLLGVSFIFMASLEVTKVRPIVDASTGLGDTFSGENGLRVN